MYDAFTSANYTLDERRLAMALGGGGSGGGVSYMPDGTTITLDASGLLTVNPNLFYPKSELDAKLSARWRWKGTANTINDLPTSGNEVGDTYTVRDAGDGISNAEYGWDGSKWEFIGPTLDLSGYALTETVKELIKAHADDYTCHVTLADRQAWDRATVDLDRHIAETSKHVSADERTAWNAKADVSLVSAETSRATSAEQELRTIIQNTVDDLADKVDKVDGKGLSQEDFTTEYKNRIHMLESELALLKEQGVGGSGSTDPQMSQVSFIGGTSGEPQMIHLEVGKIYVATGPFRAILPVNPPNGSIIRLSVETGMEEMWVDATEETTISGTKQEVAAGMTPEGLLINNATYQFVFNAAANNWIVF
jgi:hypothetical protein